MKSNFINIIKYGLSFLIAIEVILIPETKSAEKIAFVNGIFSRTVSIENLEKFLETGTADGFLKTIVNMDKNKSKEIISLLNEEAEMSLVLTSKLMNTKIGETIIKRIAQIIYPMKLPKESISIPAIRSAVIKGLDTGQGKLNLLLFLKSYPNKIITLDIPALYRVINKVESISELVRFFSNSPLNGTISKDGHELD